MKRNMSFVPLFFVVTSAIISTQAQAAVDPDITDAITAAATDGATVAAAVLLIFLGIKAVKWLRGAL